MDVARAFYNEMVEFDGRQPNRLREVSIVNIDAETTRVIRKKFAEWFGNTPTVSRLVKDYNFVLFIRKQDFAGGDQLSSRDSEVIRGEVFILQRRCKKVYVPEKFTFFWKEEWPFSQHHKCSFVIEKISYNCAEQWMMKKKALVFRDEEMAGKMIESDDPKRMQRIRGKVIGLDQKV